MNYIDRGCMYCEGTCNKECLPKQKTTFENEFVSYAAAVELKQLGFDEPCIAYYNGRFLDFKIWNDDGCEASQINVNMDVGQCPNAPTFSQVFRWFREKYSLIGEIFSQLRPSNNFMYGFKIGGSDIIFDGFQTYEEAELECLLKLIETVKTK